MPVEFCARKYRQESWHSEIHPSFLYLQWQQERHSWFLVIPLESQATQGSGSCYLSRAQCRKDSAVPHPAYCSDGRERTSVWREEKGVRDGSTGSGHVSQVQSTGVMMERNLEQKSTETFELLRHISLSFSLRLQPLFIAPRCWIVSRRLSLRTSSETSSD